jgi:hypothetical protein
LRQGGAALFRKEHLYMNLADREVNALPPPLIDLSGEQSLI